MPWMTNLFNNEPNFPNRPLTETTIPGTHDAGCYVDHGYGRNFLARTQTQDIAGQLAGGIRYFDIRPYLTRAQEFWTYHGPYYGGQLDGNAGILADVQQFMAGLQVTDRELVILNISHFSRFDNAAHANLIAAIQTALGPHLVPHTQAQISLFNTPYVNLLTDTATGNIRSRVAILYDGALDTPREQYVNNTLSLPAGFFKLGPKYVIVPNPIYLFDQYANKASMDDGSFSQGMVPNQMDKLANRQNYRYTTQAWGGGLPNWIPNNPAQNRIFSTLHLFSWTLTPQPITDPITAAQNNANPRLLPQFTGNNWGVNGVPYDITVHPKINIIYVDDYSSAIAVNAAAPRTNLAMPVAIADFLNRYNTLGGVVWNGWAGF
jgi:hypothetical protein